MCIGVSHASARPFARPQSSDYREYKTVLSCPLDDFSVSNSRFGGTKPESTMQPFRLTMPSLVFGSLLVGLTQAGCVKSRTASTDVPSVASEPVSDIEFPAPEWEKQIAVVRAGRLARIESDLRVGDAEVVQLAPLLHLTDVVLPNANVTDGSVEALSKLPSLKVLVLGDTTITDAGLASLAGSTSLRQLNLNDSRVTDRGLEHLVGLTQLELLRLGRSEVSDDGLAVLGRIASLRYLILQNAHITGSGFHRLHGLKKLESLYLHGNPLTGKGEHELRQALPGLHPDW